MSEVLGVRGSSPLIIPGHSTVGGARPLEGVRLDRRSRRGAPGRGLGILPLAKSTEAIFGGWRLPGHGDPYGDCGEWRSKGCLNVDEHTQEGLLGPMAGKVFVRRYRRTCVRAECPVCYEAWAGTEAGKIEYRLMVWEGRGRPIHVVVSPPVEDWARLKYEDLRRKAYSVAKKSGVLGGSCIFHPWREEESTKTWQLSPHFHIIGYGWVRGTKEGYLRHGWVVKNVGIRESVSATALYQLSHAGIHYGYHTVTWFGSVAYNKLWVPPKLEGKEVCPICGQPLRELWYMGTLALPEEEGDFWLDPGGWVYKPQRFRGGG